MGGWLRVDAVTADAVRPCFAAAVDPQQVATWLREHHVKAQARLDSLRKVTITINMTLLGLPPLTAVVVDGIGQCTINSYEPCGPGYVVRRIHHADTFAISYVAADQVRPTCDDTPTVPPFDRLAHLKSLHDLEVQRLERVREANALVSDLHDNLPIGSEVRILQTAQCAAAGRVGHILRHIRRIEGDAEDEPRYLLQLHSPTALSLSSDSYIEVSTHQVRPEFWTSRKPMESATSLIQNCRGSVPFSAFD